MNKIIQFGKCLILGLSAMILFSCDDNPNGTDKPPVDPTTGILEVDFKLPPIQFLPDSRIHRVELCLGYNEDSIYRSLFFDCANPSDLLQAYTFNLAPGIYYYQAGVSCSAQGDSCGWAGFPGGRYGIRYSVTRVEIKAGEKTTSSPGFQ
ncbi:MAG: hypothetical protein D4R64_05655 [Porphyromonadaceae bacterium]|nr:MAG: hypothetical protein D4R64_05655 [Porphyromonadaceae bacterium]